MSSPLSPGIRAQQTPNEGSRQREDAAPAIVWTTDKTGACDFISEGWYEFTGQSEQEALGSGWLNAIHPDDRTHTYAAFQEAYQNLSGYWARYRLLSGNGAYRWALGTGRPRFSSKGEFLGLIGSVIDLDQHRPVGSALQESEDLFQTLADNMSQFAWIANQEGWVFWYNKRWYEYTGTTLDQMQGWGWQKVHHPNHVDRVVELIKRHFESGEAWEDTFPLRSKTGEYRWFLSRALPIQDDRGRVVRWFGTNTDITHQLETERALELANQDLEQFAAVVSHDLKHPLRNITVYAQMLQRDHSGQLNEEARQMFSRIVSGAEQMGRLMSDLLEYSHAAAQNDLPVDRIDSGAVLAQVLGNLAHPIADTRATVTADDPLPVVAIRATHLEQLLQNLVINGIKYCAPGTNPKVHISAAHQHGLWWFSVRDNGLGIPEDSQEAIFGLFTRLNPDHGECEGTGLGLAICQRIVHRYGGRIWVESVPGQGTTFHFTLPGHS